MIPEPTMPTRTRRDAEADHFVKAVKGARFIYLADGSPLHLRSVLKDTSLLAVIIAAWRNGGVLAASGAGATVLCDPMVDPRGGAFTVGLGLVSHLAFVPHHDTWSPDKARRTIELAPRGVPIVAVDERTALVRQPDGAWDVRGAGSAAVFVDG